jgi:hypothetical protein
LSFAALLLAAPLVHAQFETTLKPKDAAGFEAYARSVETELALRAKGAKPFLWIEERPDLRAQAEQGQVVVDRRGPRPDLDDAMIHDWNAAVFVPGATSAQVMEVLLDYERHPQIYAEVMRGKILSRGEHVIRPYLRLRKKKIITVILNSEYDVRWQQVGPNRWRIDSFSTRITEVEDAGTPEEKEKAPDAGNGFLWRLHAFWSLEERPGGVMLECRTVSLSRDVPFGLGRIIGPLVEGLPRESLVATLAATRAEVQRRKRSSKL